jgi:diguanylate cyclase (GGDEF)-like protein/PAS domain S-box-containing protein
MKNWKRIFPRRAYLFGLIGLMLTASLGLGAYAVIDAKKAALERAKVVAESLSQTVEFGIRRTLDAYSLSLHAAVQALSDEQVLRAPHFLQRQLIFGQPVKDDALGSMLVLDPHGLIVRDSRREAPLPSDLSDRDYFLAHLDRDAGLFISAPFVSRLDGRWSIALSRRITDRNGAFGGVIVGTIKLDYLKNLFSKLSVGDNGTISLFRADGIAIMRHPFAEHEIGKSFSNVGLFRYMRTANSGSFDQVAVKDGVERRYVFAKVGDYPLVFSIGLAFKDILADWSGKALTFLMLGAALYGSMFLLAYHLARESRQRLLAEKQVSENARRFAKLAENSRDGIVIRNAWGKRTYASPRFFEMLGRSDFEVGTKPLSEFSHPDTRDRPRRALRDLRLGAKSVTEVLHCLRPDGSSIWLEAISTPVRGKDHELLEIVTNVRDVTIHKLEKDQADELRARLEADVLTDSLTGIPNRRAFDIAVNRLSKAGKPSAILMIDVDHFKAFNDAFGHLAGDRALSAIAASLLTSVRRSGDMVARFGGEEFAVLLNDLTGGEAEQVAEALCQKVQDLNIDYPEQLDGCLSVSIGLLSAIITDAVAALGKADEALYEAKRTGRNRVAVYRDPEVRLFG